MRSRKRGAVLHCALGEPGPATTSRKPINRLPRRDERDSHHNNTKKGRPRKNLFIRKRASGDRVRKKTRSTLSFQEDRAANVPWKTPGSMKRNTGPRYGGRKKRSGKSTREEECKGNKRPVVTENYKPKKKKHPSKRKKKKIREITCQEAGGSS